MTGALRWRGESTSGMVAGSRIKPATITLGRPYRPWTSDDRTDACDVLATLRWPAVSIARAT